jgi:hypothetical protein
MPVDVPAVTMIKFIPVMCPNAKCRGILMVPPTARGKIIQCSKCKKLVGVPAQSPPSKTYDRRTHLAAVSHTLR